MQTHTKAALFCSIKLKHNMIAILSVNLHHIRLTDWPSLGKGENKSQLIDIVHSLIRQ